MNEPRQSLRDLKVALLTTSFPKYEGDRSGIFVFKFAQALARRGCRVHVLAPHDAQVDESHAWSDIDVTYFKYFFPVRWQILAHGGGLISRIKNNWLSVLQAPFFMISFFLAGFRATRDAGIIQSFWTFGAFIALLIKPIRRIPVVVRVSGSDVFFIKTPGVVSLFKSLLKRADAIVCQSRQFKEQLTAIGVPGKNISVIANGIELDNFKPGNRSLNRKKLSLPQDKTIVLTVGALVSCKGQKYLIEAIPEILQKRKNILFVFVGDGELHSRLEKQVREGKLTDHVLFAGFQNHRAVPDWLNAADVFVLPSLREGSPNVLLEAMACGKPIITTPVNGISEMIEEGIDGLLVEPANPSLLAERIVTLINDPDRRRRLGQNARKTLREKYGSWDDQAALLMALYNQLPVRQRKTR